MHGDIYLNLLEVAILDTEPMQRLRRVRQLGTAHLVYPGASHTRFSHALGTLRAAQDLMDLVLAQRQRPGAVSDLFAEWKCRERKYRETKEGDPLCYDKEVAQATVLARMGALLHDLGHIPFGHTLEDDLGILDPHDNNELRYQRLWRDLTDELLEERNIIIPASLTGALMPLIISKFEGGQKPEEQCYPFVTDIIGDTICADLIDYSQRDHRYTGIPAEVGNRFLDGFYVTRSEGSNEQRRMVVRITKDGQQRVDVVSELLKYLRYRYELSERVLVHHAKLAADVMIGKMCEMWLDAIKADLSSKAGQSKVRH